MKTATSLRCIALVLAALASRPCHAQGAIDLDALATPQPASVRTVMSGAEFDAAMEAVGFDAGQRTTAGSMFDDAQARMFEAKRAADAQARGLGMFDRSARTVEERAKATRELRTRMLATVDELFSSLPSPRPSSSRRSRASAPRPAGASSARRCPEASGCAWHPPTPRPHSRSPASMHRRSPPR
jgi:hypothetical protein